MGHKINRKSLFPKQQTFEIAPKPKKVNEQIDEIRRKRTFEIELSRLSQSSPDLTATSMSAAEGVRRGSDSTLPRASTTAFDRAASGSMSTLSPLSKFAVARSGSGSTLHEHVQSGSNHSMSMDA